MAKREGAADLPTLHLTCMCPGSVLSGHQQRHTQSSAAGLCQHRSNGASTVKAACRVARRVFAGEAVTKENVASSLLRNSRVNLWGMGATLLGLQVGCGMSACISQQRSRCKCKVGHH